MKAGAFTFYKIELKSMVLLLSVNREKGNRMWLASHDGSYTLNKPQRFEP